MFRSTGSRKKIITFFSGTSYAISSVATSFTFIHSFIPSGYLILIPKYPVWSYRYHYAHSTRLFVAEMFIVHNCARSIRPGGFIKTCKGNIERIRHPLSLLSILTGPFRNELQEWIYSTDDGNTSTWVYIYGLFFLRYCIKMILRVCILKFFVSDEYITYTIQTTYLQCQLYGTNGCFRIRVIAIM